LPTTSADADEGAGNGGPQDAALKKQVMTLDLKDRGFAGRRTPK
jgi:hypothetical protein